VSRPCARGSDTQGSDGRAGWLKEVEEGSIIEKEAAAGTPGSLVEIVKVVKRRGSRKEN